MHYFLFVIIFCALMSDKLNIFFYLILSSLFHEAGHIVACIVCGGTPKIEVTLFGIKLKGYPYTKVKKLIVLICGPLVNLVMILVSQYMLHDSFRLNIYVFMVVNIIVLLFNCLPVFFLDGGQIIGAFCDNTRIRYILDIISLLIVFAAIIVISQNMLFSVLLFLLFIIYYIINKTSVF